MSNRVGRARGADKTDRSGAGIPLGLHGVGRESIMAAMANPGRRRPGKPLKSKPGKRTPGRSSTRSRTTNKRRATSRSGRPKRPSRTLRLHLDMQTQPDDTTCGPTCLHAVYRYYGLDYALGAVIAETRALEGGGTLAVLLGSHALRRGFTATIYTFNIQVFDPTWFSRPGVDLRAKLLAQKAAKSDPKLQLACDAYLEFLELGGDLRFRDLTTALIRKYLKAGVPILTGLSATYLYQTAREAPPDWRDDDVAGEPAGHFVVLCGYDPNERAVRVADPLHPDPMAPARYYSMDINRVLCSILLGVVTYDANLLILEPNEASGGIKKFGGEVRRPTGL